jgi:hypothetical protein
LHHATVFNDLAASGCTTGSPLASCGVEVNITLVSAYRNRNQRVSQPAAIAIRKRENPRTQQVTEAAVSNKIITAQKEPVDDNTGASRENIILEICNIQSIISLLLFAAPICSIRR